MFHDISEMIKLTGKTAIITGGSMGIGQGCSRAFLAADANVVICARGESDGEKTAFEFCKEYGGGRCVFIKCDVSSEEDVKRVVDQTVEMHGRIDVLVNNAGYHPPYESMDDTTGEMFLELLKVNLYSMYIFSLHALPYLRKTKGNIVNMSSLVGTIGQRNSCRYVATKAGIHGLTKGMAIDEARHGVRVNSVSPGCIDTPLGAEFGRLSGNPEREAELTNSFIQLKRVGDIHEVGTVCLFLASDMAKYMTGVDIPVSGGAELAYGVKC